MAGESFFLGGRMALCLSTSSEEGCKNCATAASAYAFSGMFGPKCTSQTCVNRLGKHWVAQQLILKVPSAIYMCIYIYIYISELARSTQGAPARSGAHACCLVGVWTSVWSRESCLSISSLASCQITSAIHQRVGDHSNPKRHDHGTHR